VSTRRRTRSRKIGPADPVGRPVTAACSASRGGARGHDGQALQNNSLEGERRRLFLKAARNPPFASALAVAAASP
jgi:hypothetical protein